MQINSWSDAIVHFFENDIKSSTLYKARDAYDKKLTALKTEKEPKKISKLKKDIESKEQALLEVRKGNISDEIKRFVYSWAIENKSPYAVPESHKLITKVTHPLKFSHSADINAGICDSTEVTLDYLSTGEIKNKGYDLTQHNGAIIQLVRFLAVSYKSEMIYDCVIVNNFNFLNDFKLTKDERETWESQFKAWNAAKPINTAGRAKQIYFPLQSNDDAQQYHLLAILHSSTLSYEVYKRVYSKRFSDLNRDIKNQKEKDKYHPNVSTSYPNLAAVEYGNGQPQNISLLNTATNGLSYLLPCPPPKYKKITKPPMQFTTVFDDSAFNKVRVKDTLTYMTDFLIRFSSVNKSVKASDKKLWLVKWCDQIIEEFFQYIYGIHELDVGWSLVKECKLRPEYKLLLDPFHGCNEVLEQIKASDWQSDISSDFSNWLNRALEDRNNKFTGKDWHKAVWRECFATELRVFVDEIKQIIKTEARV